MKDFIQGHVPDVMVLLFLHQSNRTYHFLKSQELKECKSFVIRMAEDLKGFQGAGEKVCQIFGVEKLFPERINALKAFISIEGVFYIKLANGVRKVVGVYSHSYNYCQTIEDYPKLVKSGSGIYPSSWSRNDFCHWLFNQW